MLGAFEALGGCRKDAVLTACKHVSEISEMPIYGGHSVTFSN